VEGFFAVGTNPGGGGGGASDAAGVEVDFISRIFAELDSGDGLSSGKRREREGSRKLSSVLLQRSPKKNGKKGR